ncbi:hypothetical protein [Planctomonas psychrotolerans]|uniref:hypothetical protein n=1 Tax=Planctomonas psychrotolerans TaxID=2528712 RepID=UPI00123A7CEA|nr:hypothetical protein [Planctomonas psychrotolerans]
MTDDGMRSRAAARLLTEIERDPGLAGVLADHYAGRHDVRDALWWTAHPGSPAPSGRPDPTGELETLRRALYSRDGQDSALVEVVSPATGERLRMREAEARIVACRGRIDADAAAMEGLLDFARRREADRATATATTVSAYPAATGPAAPALPSGTAGLRVRDGDRDAAAPSAAAPSAGRPNADGADGADGPGGPVDGARPWLPALLLRARRAGPTVPALFAALGLVFGAALTWAVVSSGIDATPAANSTLEPGSAADTARALEVFGRAPTETDRLPEEYFLGSPHVSGRLLYADDTLRVWAYRDRGEVCLFLQDREAAAGTCTTEDLFVSNGITLPLPYHGVTMTSGADGTPAPALAELTWAPSGAIEIQAISVLR